MTRLAIALFAITILASARELYGLLTLRCAVCWRPRAIFHDQRCWSCWRAERARRR